MTVQPTDLNYVYSTTTGSPGGSASPSATSDDSTVEFGTAGQDENVDSFESSGQVDDKKAELEAKKEAEKQRKEIHEKILKLQKAVSELEAKLSSADDSQKEEINAQISQYNSQIGDLKSQLNEITGESQDSSNTGSREQVMSINPSDANEQMLEEYKQNQISQLDAHAPSSSGGSNPFGSTTPVSYTPTSSNAGTGNTGNSGMTAPRASGNAQQSTPIKASSSGGTTPSGEKSSTPASTGATVNNNAISANGTNWGEYGYNSEKGKKLAQTTISQHANSGSRNRCLAGVSQTVKSTLGDSHLTGLGSAYMAADALANDSNFQEIKLDNYNDIHNLPAGAIVVWSQYDRDGDGRVGDSDGGQHGHITMTDGNDHWYSDHYDNYDIVSWYHGKKGATARVFIPV